MSRALHTAGGGAASRPGRYRTPGGPSGAATRTAALWIPDWPVLAAMAAREVPAHIPAATHDGRRVVAVSAVARAQGVRRGMRHRLARECCPELVLLDADDAVAARDFEPVALAAESVVAGLEVLRPGLVLLPAAGAARYHGSEEHLAAALLTAVAERTGQESQAGVADGILAAVLAARESRILDDSNRYLARQPTTVLIHVADGPELGATRALIQLLARLGVHTLGDLAALPADRIEARFGLLGAWAHRLACGQDLRPPVRRRIEPDAAVTSVFDPPAVRADHAAFVARRLAEELCAVLASRSVIAGRLRITARTEHGMELERTWRAGAQALTAARITDRVRWQIDGWLSGTGNVGVAPVVAPLTRLSITAEEIVPAGAQQPRLWGASSGRDGRAHRALGRVQGLLGGPAVLLPKLQGGRDVRDPVRLMAFGEDGGLDRDPALPWPGRLPAPRPALVPAEPWAATVCDAAGHRVVVDARGAISADPVTCCIPTPLPTCCGRENCRGSTPTTRTIHAHNVRSAAEHHKDGQSFVIRDWAGPWLLAERWWSPDPRRRAYLQVILDDGTALLLATSGGLWSVEGIYD